jgi:hypothetical protein
MTEKIKKLLFLIILLLVFGFFPFKGALAGSADNVSGWAWSENIGWVSFNSTNCDSNGNNRTDKTNYSNCPAGDSVVDYGTRVDLINGVFSGYAWSENIGWISFNSDALINCPSGACQARLDTASYNASGLGKINGWARACSVFEKDCKGNLDNNSNRGGWEGWIHFADEINYPPKHEVFIDKTDNNEFKNWAWGDDLVIGWVSFNHRNCDTDNDTMSEGVPVGCPAATESISEYKVMLSSAASVVVDPDKLKVTKDNPLQYCGSIHASNPPVSFGWDHPDQKGYELEIYEGANLVGGNLVGGNLIESSCSVIGCCGSHSCGGSSKAYTAQALKYNKTYSWRLKVWDNNDNESDWVVDNPHTFDTISYRYPDPDFSWDTPKIVVNSTTTFTAASGIFDNPGGGTLKWDFGDGTSGWGSPVIHSYITPRSINIKLTATANWGEGLKVCEISKSSHVYFAPPNWIEIPPPTK